MFTVHIQYIVYMRLGISTRSGNRFGRGGIGHVPINTLVLFLILLLWGVGEGGGGIHTIVEISESTITSFTVFLLKIRHEIIILL